MRRSRGLGDVYKRQVLGSPAKVVRPLTPAEQASLPGWAEKYVKVAAHHRRFE
jgi:carbonic anhydrase/acetyltransferase-like protein (isoleucine patch superfamily)